MKLRHNLLFVFACLVFFLFSAQAQIINSQQIQQINALFKEWDSTHSPGGTVGIFKNGELIFTNAFGMASLEYDVPNTTATLFNIASVSKQVTAYSLVLLEQQGKLSLDDEVQKYLPEVPDFGEKITLRHLLHHTSGLRNFQNMLAMAGWRDGDSMTNDDLLRIISNQKELNFKPGEEYLYCNTGFNLATEIVERVSGQRFQDWTRENIFEPLGMNDSGYREDMEAIHKNTATSYDGDTENGFRQPLKYWTYMGNGNVYTSIADLAKWLENFRKPIVGGTSGIQTLVTPGILNNGDTLDYALGIGVGDYRGLLRYSHGGSVGGYRSNMVYFPEEALGIIVLSNFSSANPGGKVQGITNILLADKLEALPESPRPIAEQKTVGPIALSAKELATYTGNYFVDGVIVNFSQTDNQLFVFAEGQLPAPVPLTPTSKTEFFAEQAPIKIAFRGKDKERIRVELGSDVYSGMRMASAKKLENLPGVYYSPELDARYEISKDGEQFLVKHHRHTDFYLVPVGEDQLSGTAYFFSDVKVIRNNKDNITGIRVSNGRVRNLWFEKL